MKKNEIIVLVIFITSLLVINTYNFLRKERMEESHSMLIERGKIKMPINDVGAGELENLPGIGPVLARRIVDYRDQIGRFSSLEELKRVNGIGDKLYQKICPYLRL